MYVVATFDYISLNHGGYLATDQVNNNTYF